MKEIMTTHDILNRGVEQILPSTTGLSTLMGKRKIRVYLGIDPTGNQLHLGHAVVLKKLQQFAQLGHEVILLVGNGTVKIGDPTGKDKTRPLLTDEQIEENFSTWKKQASKILDFSLIKIKYNGDWLDKLTYADFIQLCAKFTVQQMMERDMFVERVKNNLPVHIHELLYPIMQGYDSVAMDVDLEIGGSDQIFNMMRGRDLQKIERNKEKWVLGTKIINGLDGRKMSKSYNNFVSLIENPADMFGKLMSVADSEIITYFEVLTDTSTEELKTLQARLESGENPMELKKRLAFEITRWLHDETEATQAQSHFEKTVQNKELPDKIPSLQVEEKNTTMLNLVSLARPEMSKSEARRLIEQGGVELDGAKHHNPIDAVVVKNGQVLRVGKRQYFKIR
jgi:tyrosyl-tRNA synthetase